ncbi:DUF2933 domain-containing protein [Bacillus sp. SCS-151]
MMIIMLCPLKHLFHHYFWGGNNKWPYSPLRGRELCKVF